MNQQELELVRAQKSHWPTSEILTPEEVIEWAYNSTLHCRQVLMTIQYRCGVFYRIPYTYTNRDHGLVQGEYRGFRYGTSGPDYLSF